MDYLNNINNMFPIRRSSEQKEQFSKFIIEETKKYDKHAVIDVINKNNNIIIGDVKKAKVFITAHYDTPARSLIPNLMMPRNLLLFYLYHLLYPITLAMLSLLAAYGIAYILEINSKIIFLVF